MRNLALVISAILFSAFLCLAAGAAGPGADRAISITVTDKATGEPISGATIHTPNEKSSTNDFGQCAITIPADADYFFITATKSGYVTTFVNWQNVKTAKAIPHQFDFPMIAGVTVGGKIIDESGHPISAATINIDSGEDSHPDGAVYSSCAIHAVTDATGMWVSNEAPSDLAAADYQAEAKGFVVAQEFQVVPSIDALRKRTFVATLQHAATLSGTVLDPTGQPVANAAITQGNDSDGVLDKTRTNNEGHFSLERLTPGPVTFGVASESFAPQIVNTSAPATQPVTVHMQPGKLMKFHVVDRSGDPISGVNIFIAQYHDNRYVRYSMKTNADGDAAWPGGPPDPIVMNFWKKGLGMLTDKDIAPSAQPIPITLGVKTHVNGTVLDAVTGKPIENFRVIPGLLARGADSPQFTNESWGGTIKNLGDGTFTYDPDQPYPQYVLRVQAPGYLPTDSAPFDNISDQLPLTIKLAKGVGIEGVVYDANHKPVADADVHMAVGNQTIQIGKDGNITELNTQTPPMQTDEHGHFGFVAQPDAFALVCLTPQGYARLDVPALHPKHNFPAFLPPPSTTRPSNYDLILQPLASVRGKLMVGSKPDRHAQVNLQLVQTFWSNEQPRIFLDFGALTDFSGEFHFESVPPGALTVEKTIQIGPTQGSGISTMITVLPGQTATVNLGGTGRPVVGKFAIPLSFPPGWIPWNTRLVLHTPMPKGPEMPLAIRLGSKESKREWIKQWLQTPDGQAFSAAMKKPIPITRTPMQFDVAKDGSFRIDDVPAGNYLLTADFFPGDVMQTGQWGQRLGTGQQAFEIPSMPGNRSDTPLDLGVITISPPKTH